MLKATQRLIDDARSSPPGSQPLGATTEARANLIARWGGPEDASALLSLFLEDPTDYDHACLLDPIMRLGHQGTARSLVSACLSENRLKPGVPESVLRAIGFLGHAEARDALWQYAQDGSDYYAQHEASIGLLSLPCEDLGSAIEAAVRACAGPNLFPEFLPVLAHMAGNPEMLPLIVDIGQTSASTDCNAGIVYGISLFGEVGRPYFDRILFDPAWETWSSSTGTVRWAYHGFRQLGGRLSDLVRGIRASRASLSYSEWELRARTWLELAISGIHSPLPPIRTVTYANASAPDVYAAAFDWSTPKADDSLLGMIERDGWLERDAVHNFSVRLADRIVYEVCEGELRQGQGSP